MIDSFQGEHRFLSNFWLSPVEFEGLIYPSVEHAYQAAKTFNPEDRKRIAAMSSPGQAKKAGKSLKLRVDWEQEKVGIMEYLVHAKFSTHNDLYEKLLATGTQELVEGNTWGDTIWGVCNGVGQNLLGKILMKVRKEFADKT